MKNQLLGISVANKVLLKEPSIEVTLETCLKIAGESHGFDRSYILKIKKDSINYCYEWCNIGIPSLKNSTNFEKEILSSFAETQTKPNKDEPIYGLVDEFTNASFPKIMKSRKVKSYLFTPIFVEEVLWGWAGYENCTNDMHWDKQQVHLLHLLAKNIGIRIQKNPVFAIQEDDLNFFNDYIKDSNHGVWELDVQTLVPTYSPNWAGMLGYATVEIEHMHDFWKNNIHSDDLIRAENETINFILGNIDTYEGIYRMKHKNGQFIWIKYNGLLKIDKEGKPLKIIGSHINISELKEKEHQLQISEQKYRFIAENTSDLICQHALDGTYTYVSKAVKEMVGYEPDEILNKSPLDFIHPNDFENMIKMHKKFINDGELALVTFRYRKKNNRYVWLESAVSTILDENNVFIGIQTSNRNVSVRIKAEQETQKTLKIERQLTEMKSRFVSMASHQFRTPLTVIYSNAELIEILTNDLEKKTANSFASITSRIKREVDRMTELMNNVLIFGKYESNAIKKEVKPISLDPFLKKLLNTYFDQALDKQKIKLSIKGEKQLFKSDETLLVHIVTNLVSNAFKYSAGKSNPLLNLTYLEKGIEIEVIDYGIGIPQNDIQYLFTSFFRASNSSTIIGSGLGLAIAKQFTHYLKGTIELKTKENFGTTIKLNFPYEQK